MAFINQTPTFKQNQKLYALRYILKKINEAPSPTPTTPHNIFLTILFFATVLHTPHLLIIPQKKTTNLVYCAQVLQNTFICCFL